MTAPPHSEATALVARFEGFHKRLADGRAAPYLCPAGVPTIGEGTTRYPDGQAVTMGDVPITQHQARAYLEYEMLACARAVDRLVRVPITPRMRGALISFAYNVGTGALRSSTLLRRVNARRWAEVPKQFARWRIGGGRVLPGLVRRRQAEAALFMAGVVNIEVSGQRLALNPAGWSTITTIAPGEPPAPEHHPRRRQARPHDPFTLRRVFDWLFRSAQ